MYGERVDRHEILRGKSSLPPQSAQASLLREIDDTSRSAKNGNCRQIKFTARNRLTLRLLDSTVRDWAGTQRPSVIREMRRVVLLNSHTPL